MTGGDRLTISLMTHPWSYKTQRRSYWQAALLKWRHWAPKNQRWLNYWMPTIWDLKNLLDFIVNQVVAFWQADMAFWAFRVNNPPDSQQSSKDLKVLVMSTSTFSFQYSPMEGMLHQKGLESSTDLLQKRPWKQYWHHHHRKSIGMSKKKMKMMVMTIIKDLAFFFTHPRGPLCVKWEENSIYVVETSIIIFLTYSWLRPPGPAFDET